MNCTNTKLSQKANHKRKHPGKTELLFKNAHIGDKYFLVRILITLEWEGDWKGHVGCFKGIHEQYFIS